MTEGHPTFTGPAIDELRARLELYLGTNVGSIRVLASGWETTVFEFAIDAGAARSPDIPIGVPVVLRFYEGNRALDKGAREYQTMGELADAGYPVPTPYLFEPALDVLGAPFLAMERLSGGPLFAARSFPAAFKTFSMAFIAFVRAQTRLHRIDLGKILHHGAAARAFIPENGASGAPLLDRILAIIAERIEGGPLPGLKPALEVLRERAPEFAASPSAFVHMDYHPQNVLVSGVRVTGVIDWVNADLGDRHLDTAMTSVIMATSALEQPRWMRDNPAGNSLRLLFTALYIPLYHAIAPLDFARFRYCQAVAAVARLSMLGMMRVRGAESVGFRSQAIAEVTPAVMRLLTRYASRKTSVPVAI